jgi:hypothetical protein
MKRILDWLKEKMAQPTDDIDDSGTRGAEREVVMPDIYGEKHEATKPHLKILDPTSPEIDESTGFDPYDTVVLHEKQGVKKGLKKIGEKN